MMRPLPYCRMPEANADDFGKLLALLRRFPHPATFAVKDDALLRLIVQHGGMAIVRVRARAGSLQVECVQQQGKLDEDALMRRIRQVVGAAVPTSDFFQRAQQDKTLWPVVEPVRGMPLFCTDTLYEALVFSILEQQIAWVAAQKAQRWLVEWGGVAMAYQGERHYAMPPPEKLARATVDDLKPLKITFKRMRLLIDLSQKIVSGELVLDAWQAQTPQDLYQSLLTLKGVGHWTAANVVHRTTGKYPYVLDTDVALQRAVSRYFYGGTARVSRDVVRETFAPYGDDAGLAAHYTLMRYVMDAYAARL